MYPFGEYPEGYGSRVVINRDARGAIRRYGDPDTGQTLTRNEAIGRMKYNFSTGEIEDSMGNSLKIGEIALKRGHETSDLINARQVTSPMNRNPYTYKTARNEELIERLIVVGKNGEISKIDISYGSGKSYDPNRLGGTWRAKVANAVGLEKGERLPTADLERMVVSKQIVVRRTYVTQSLVGQ